MDKITALEISKEIRDMFENWLISSNLTKEKFLCFRLVKGFKIYQERDNEGKLVLYLTSRHDDQTYLMGANLTAASTDDETFLMDAGILIRYMAKLLDDENKNNPVHGSYENDYFILHSGKYFEVKEGF